MALVIGGMNEEKYKRDVATQRIEDIKNRAVTINNSNEYTYGIQKISIFGSYNNTDRIKIGDVDLVIDIYGKYQDNSIKHMSELQMDKDRECISKAMSGGRMFSNCVYQLEWPKTKVKLFLKNHSKIISLHDGCYYDEERRNKFQVKEIWMNEKINREAK